MTDRDNKAKRRASITSVLALLILTTSLSQCNGENYGEFESGIESLDHNHDHDFNTGNLNNENEVDNSNDLESEVIDDGYEEASGFSVEEDSSALETTDEVKNDNSSSGKKIDKKTEEKNNDASAGISSIISPVPTINDDASSTPVEETPTEDTNSNDNGNNDDESIIDKIIHIHKWGPWQYKDSENEIRYCEKDSSHTQTRKHNYSAYHYNATTGKDEAVCSGCGHKLERAHQHHYGNDKEEVVASDDVCYKTYHECSECNGKEYTGTYGHTLSGWSYNSQSGKDEATCSKCHKKFEKTHVHSYGPNQETIVASADVCYSTSHTCSACSHSESTGSHGHTYGNWTYNSSTGKEERTCSKCHRKEERAHTHSYGSNQETIVASADVCYTTSHTCSVCSHSESTGSHGHTYGNWTYNSSTGKEERTCSKCHRKEERTHTHSYGSNQEEIVGTSDACYKTYHICNVCSNKEYTGTVSSHSYGDWSYNSSTGKEERTCSKCHRKEERAHTHSYGSNQEEIVGSADVCYKTYHICNVCSNKEYTGTVSNHSYGNWTYNSSTGQEERTCSKCNHKETRAHSHTWVDGVEEISGDGVVCYRTYHQCSVCNAKEYIQDYNHTFGSWTDNGDDEIRVCTHNSAHIEHQAHSWSESISGTTKTSTCPTCGATRTETVECQHNWVAKEKTIKQGDVCWEEWEECSECGETRNVQSHGHSFGEPVDDGDGGLIYECSRCHLQKSSETLGARRNPSTSELYLDVFNNRNYLASVNDYVELYYEDKKNIKTLTKNKKGRC